MFVLAIIFGVIIGYILKGRLSNLESMELKGIYLIGFGFAIEFVIILLIRKNIFTAGINTLFLDILMYLLIFTFIFLNRKNRYIVIMGIGFMLNALAIFSNGGTMPVSTSALKTIGFSTNVHTEGLYTLINANTNLSFLGDTIPIDFIGRFVVSLGDIISAIGLVLFIVTSMRKSVLK